MNKAVKNFVSYLMITLLFILNLLPMMSAFAQEVTGDTGNTVEKEGLKVTGKIEDTSTQEDSKTVTYEIMNIRDVPIKNIILKQKNKNDSPIKFVLDTLSEERGPTALEEQAKVETNEEDQTTDIKIPNLQPNTTRKITINGQITTKTSSKLLVSVLVNDNEKGTLEVDLPIKNILADKEFVSKEKQETSETKVEDKGENQTSETASSTNEMTSTTSNETKPEAGKATESTQEAGTTQDTESAEQPSLQAQPTGPLVPPTPGRGFDTPIYQSVHRGELFSTGNTNLKIANENTVAAQTFLNTRGASSGYAINNFPLEFADVDNDPNTYNSSRAYIDLNGAKEIAWAGLFWSASRYKGPAYGTNLSDEEISAPVQFTTPNGTVQRVSPQRYHRIDQDATNPGQRFGYNNTGFSNYADVTSILQGDKSATGSYTLADIPMTSSLNGQYYNFSGWSLFVVTKDQASKSRAFSIYYGARGNAAGTNNEFTMSNFLTAKQGRLDPIVTWFTVQGDKYWTGDNAQIKNSAGTWVNISNTLNPVNNAMNATVTDNDEHMVDKYPGKFAPDYPNFLDIDIDRMAIPEGVLNARQNQINFRTTSSGDDYSTNAIGFAVNAETPEFEIKKEIVAPKETYKVGETITYRVSLKNTKADSEAINSVSKDSLDARLNYVPGSLKIISGPNSGVKTDVSGDDQAEYDETNKQIIVRVGNGTTATQGGSYKADTAETIYKFKARINERAKANELVPNSATVEAVDILTSAKVNETSNINIVEAKIADEQVTGKLTATKAVNNAKPKLGEEIEYTISFRNTVENGVLNTVILTDQLPKGLTYVKGSLTSVGDEPKPTSLKEANGTITAEYPSITDTKERSIRFKVIVNEEAKAGEAILNKAKVDDTVNPPEEPEVPITPEEPTENKKETKKVVTDKNKPTKNSTNEIGTNKKETSKNILFTKNRGKNPKNICVSGCRTDLNCINSLCYKEKQRKRGVNKIGCFRAAN